jgi:DNA helicase-2/ATP-dependent DNA helicase PcrA
MKTVVLRARDPGARVRCVSRVRQLSLLVSRPRAVRQRAPALLDVTLDPVQRAAIDSDDPRPLLVLGEAGHGKTTVLVHRVAELCRRATARRSQPFRVAIVVPTEGLVRLLEGLFGRLRVKAEVRSFDDWAGRQARRSFRRLPRESGLTPPNVMKLKRHPALRLALEELARREPGRIDDDGDEPAPAVGASRGDLQHLYGDRVLVELVARSGRLPAAAVTDTLEHNRVQFGNTAEREWSHVIERERLRTLDGRSMDEGTATEHAETIDPEDYPVLFELDRLRALVRGGSPRTPRRFDLVAIDEAEELSTLELALLGRSVVHGGSLVVSGDADQRTDDATFTSWEAVMHELGVSDYRTVTLPIGHRCPPHVEALARAVRDGRSVDLGPGPLFRGAPTVVRGYSDERALAGELAAEVELVLRRDQRASVALLCRSPAVSRHLHALFRLTVPLRLVLDGRFLPRGPAQVSTVDEVKGLEFDYVVVPDANAEAYPDDDGARRALYVAITRARHQVVLAHTGVVTPLLRGG